MVNLMTPSIAGCRGRLKLKVYNNMLWKEQTMKPRITGYLSLRLSVHDDIANNDIDCSQYQHKVHIPLVFFQIIH